MDILIKAKERMEFFKEKGRKLVTALGGRLEGAPALSKEEGVAIRRRAAYCILCTVTAFLFSGSPALFESMPFALALLCSSGYSGTVFIYVGAIAGTLAFESASSAHALIYTLALILRIVLSPKSDVKGRRVFEESPLIKLLIGAAMALLMGIYSFASSLGVSGVRGLLSLIFTLVCVPALIFLFTGVRQREEGDPLFEAGIASMLFVFIYSLSFHTFFGYSFALSAAFLILLAVGNKKGLLKGALTGLICSLALGINPAPLVAAGFSAGAFYMFGLIPSVIIALSASIALAIYFDGVHSVFLFTGDILLSCLLYVPLEKAGFVEKILPSKRYSEQEGKADLVAKEKQKEAERSRYASLSRAFDDLAKMFVKLSGNLRNPALFEIHDLCEGVFDRYCKKCALVAYCRQKNYEQTHESITDLAQKLRSKGYLEKEDAPEFLAKRCRNIDRIIWDINKERADMVEEAIKKDKTELFALDYEAISELLRESTDAAEEFTPDSELQNKAAKILRGLGISSMAYGAWGVRRKTVIASGVDIASIAVSSAEIREALEKGCTIAFGDPEFNFSGEFVSMTLTSRALFSAEYECASFRAEGEEVSGDRMAFFTGEGDYAYGLLCDGMGSGREAASVSEISALFFEKMLSAGNCVPVTLKLLSNFIRARSEECHCTADIFRLDRLSGKASFIKCGAPPSYVLRNGNIFKIDSRSMPLGLTKEINAEKIDLQLVNDDVVIIVSDGVAPDLEDALWLPELIGDCKDLPIKELAETIARRAKAENSASDDISVMCIKVVGV